MSKSKIARLEAILLLPELELEELRKLAWTGLPRHLRSDVWKILIGYVPVRRDRRESTLARKREEYMACREQYFSATASNTRTDEDQRLLRDILVDVPRTMPDMPLFQSLRIQQGLERVLFIWAVRHPASGYVQGINDLVTPFFATFLAHHLTQGDINLANTCSSVEELPEQVFNDMEADSYWCLTKLLDSIQDHYTVSQPGIQRMTFQLQGIVHRLDDALYEHMKDKGLEIYQFAHRWMNCLLLREMELALVVRLWDTYLSEESSGFEMFHVYVCAVLLKTWSVELQAMDDFQEMLLFLQALPTGNWDAQAMSELASQAYLLQQLFRDSPSHLE